ncbi:MAG: hypothetical protein QOG53_1637 [Frankiales bacterium]|jgi:hypothetical protein|nr:hypothetical protein [Frankiales bacterium]
MTSPYDDGGSARPPHASLDELADIAAGSTVEVQISAHVDSCAECRHRLTDVVAGSAAVSAELAALPTPPMPFDLVQRIEDAIAAEHSSAPAAPATPVEPAVPDEPAAPVDPPAEPPVVAASTPVGGSGNVVPMPERQSFWRRHGGAVASSVAASVIIAFVAVLFVGHFRDNNKSTNTTTSAAKADTGIVTTSGVDYNTKNLGAALPSLLRHQAPGGTAELTDSAAGGTTTGNSNGSGGTSGTSATPNAAQAPQARTTSKLFKQATSLPANLTALKTDPLALQQCLINLEVPPATPPLAVDLGLWNGKPAAVLVFAVERRADQVAILIAPAGCPPGEVLFYQRFTKPTP